MAWQSTLDQMKSARVNRNAVVALIIGIVLGLTLGLLIGWVWWPVEWQGSETAAPAAAPGVVGAGSQFDTPEARYLYLGATADAFALSTAAGDSNAASLAAQRLAALGGDLRSAFDGAIDFYGSQANGAAQVRNLTTLAGAVGIPLQTGAAGGGEAAPGDVPPPASAGAEATEGTGQTAAGETQGAGGNPFGWILSLLLALLLIGGGLYLLWTLNQRRTLDPDDSPSGFVDEEITSSSTSSVSSFDRSGLSPVRGAVPPAAAVRSTVERPVAVQGQDPHGFDAEDDELDAELDDEDRYPGYAQRKPLTVAPIDPDDPFANQSDRPDEEDEWVQDEEEADANEPAEYSDAAPARTNVPGTAVRTAPPPTLQPPTPSRYDRSVPLGSYTATYYAGQVDFDKAKNVSNPDGEGYLGEYHVGIPQKNGLLDHDMEKALAIEVTLFDKVVEREMVTVTRVLLSEYAHNHRYDEYQRTNPKLAPIVAQPNTNFQLEGKQLLLDCFIREVRYTREGFFQNLTMDLTVKRKL